MGTHYKKWSKINQKCAIFESCKLINVNRAPNQTAAMVQR